MMKRFLSAAYLRPSLAPRLFSNDMPFKPDFSSGKLPQTLQNPQTLQLMTKDRLEYINFKINEEGLLEEIVGEEIREDRVIFFENDLNKLLIHSMRGKRHEVAKRKRKKRKNGSNNNIRWK